MKGKVIGLILLLNLSYGGILQAKDLKIGDKAPEFTALTAEGKEISLKDFRGKTVVLYFYPKDDTPGCTIEAKGFKELFPQFTKIGAVILGVSYDDAASHREFKADYQLPFLLLVDKDKKISQAYGAEGEFFAARETFVMDPQGNIRLIFRNVNPAGHAEQVLKDIK